MFSDTFSTDLKAAQRCLRRLGELGEQEADAEGFRKKRGTNRDLFKKKQMHKPQRKKKGGKQTRRDLF